MNGGERRGQHRPQKSKAKTGPLGGQGRPEAESHTGDERERRPRPLCGPGGKRPLSETVHEPWRPSGCRDGAEREAEAPGTPVVMEQRTAGDGLVLRGEAELGRGRAPVSGEHLGSGSAGEAAAGEAACPLHPLLCQRDDWGKGQGSAPSRDAPLSRAHCGSPTPCLGFSRSVLCLLLPPAPKMQTGGSAVLTLPQGAGKTRLCANSR